LLSSDVDSGFANFDPAAGLYDKEVHELADGKHCAAEYETE